MIDEKDKGIIRQEIQTTYSERRFQLGGIPRHIHNGLDAPITFQPILNFPFFPLQPPFVKPSN